MKKYLILLILIISAFCVNAAQTVYLDARNTQSGDGTIENPFSKMSRVDPQSGYTYLFRSDVTITGNWTVRNSIHDVLIASYGGYEKAKIVTSGGELFRFNSSVTNLTIRNIDASGADIICNLRNYTNNLRVVSCNFHHCTYALRVRWLTPMSYCDNVSVDSCEMSYAYDDILYLYMIHKVSITNSLFHHANMDWKPPITDDAIASGDGAQLIGCDKITIENNEFDRSANGNKFCVIISSTAGGGGTPLIADNYIRFNNNLFLIPIKTSEGGAGVYVGGLPMSVTIEFTFNTFIGNQTGIVMRDGGNIYSNGNTYNCEPGIGIFPPKIGYSSSSDDFINPNLGITGGKPIN